MAQVSIEQLLQQARDSLSSARPADAEARCREILARQPDHAVAWQLLGIVLASQGKAQAAVLAFTRAAELRPTPESLYNLGKSLHDVGRTGEAINAYRNAIALRPMYAHAHTNLAIALHESGRFDEAVEAYREALAFEPRSAEAHYNLARALHDSQRMDEAIAMYRQAIVIRPSYAQALADMGSALGLIGEVDEAFGALRSALAMKPDLAEAHNALGNVAKDIGEIDEALQHYRRAISINSDVWAWDNYLYSLHFHPGFDALKIREEHRRWNDKFASPLSAEIKPHENDRTPDRRLRIGYVSPHLRRHPVGRFLLPLLENHDHEQFEIICYFGGVRTDGITQRLRTAADEWKNTLGLTDAQVADRIREDRVDILVDLTMHMEGSRLLTFARKPAPVQMTYLAYGSTTGLETIDYRLTDPYLDSPSAEASAERYSEQSIWLPRTYWCYEPPGLAPPVGPSPAASAGYVTFGCLNNYSKVSKPALAAWIELLRRVPHSRLIVHCPRGGHWRRIEDRVGSQGVEPERFRLVSTMPLEEYFHLYNQIDIALDPFPYAGGTTTCDALWMGVPVVSLAAETAVSRGGLSILSNVGLPELVGRDVAQYLQTAADLARDVPRLVDLRATLRQRITSSSLTDKRTFARDMEAIYRAIWCKWCESTTYV